MADRQGEERADGRIRDEVRQRIRQRGVEAGGMDVQVEGGVVTLAGIIHARHYKGLVEDLASGVPGVKEVRDELRVQQEESGEPILTTREPGANLGGSTQRS